MFLQAFSDLGSTREVNDVVVNNLEKYSCAQFSDLKAETVNDARYDVFRQQKLGEYCLHPNKEAFRLYITRCNHGNHKQEVEKNERIIVRGFSGVPEMEDTSCSFKSACKK